MKILLSDSGVINGKGTQPWEYVSGLSDAEREAVRAGDVMVVVRDYSAHHYTQSGYKVITYVSKRYIHREPTANQLRALHAYFSRGGRNA